MYILFIITSSWAYGELTIACEFANRISQQGYKPYFLVASTHKKVMESYGFSYSILYPRCRKINLIVMKDIEYRLKPGMVILADFLNYNFCEEHYGLSFEDLEIFSGRLGTFDDFDWIRTKGRMDTYGFLSSKYGNIDLLKYGFRLLPCPIVNPIQAGADIGDVFRYKLTTKELEYEIDRTDHWKNQCNLPTDRKLILFTNALWQDSYKKYEDVKKFVDVNNTLFWMIMERLAEKYTIISVGHENFYLKRENKNIHFLDSLSPNVFNMYLKATDLFVTRNIVSTSLAKAVLSGLPCLCLQNSIRFNSDNKEEVLSKISDKEARQKLETIDRAYRYKMFPVGWSTFLTPVCKNNSYLTTFYQMEMFTVQETIQKIMDILDGKAERSLSENLKQYKESLNELLSPNEILDKLTKVNHKNSKEKEIRNGKK